MVESRANKYLTWHLIWGLAFVTAVLVLVGCDGGGDDDCESATVNVSGTWSGNWQSSNGVDRGNITFASLLQTNSTITGDVSFTGSPCFTGGAISGEVCGQTFTGSLRAGGIQVDFDVTVTEDQMNGTYDVVNAGACTGDFGTVSLSR